MQVTTIAFAILMMLQSGGGRGDQSHVSGRVLYPFGGRPCESCPVSLESAGVPIEKTMTDSIGAFDFKDVRPGNYTIHVSMQGYEDAEVRVDIGSRASAMPAIIFLNPALAPPPADKPDAPVVNVAALPGKHPKKAVDLYNKAVKCREKGNADEAIAQLEEAVRIAPDFYQAHDELGKLYKAAGRFDDAEKEFMTAKRLNASSADPLIQLSSLYIDRGEPEAAVRVGEEAVRKDSRSASAFFNLGLALYRISRLDSAEDVLKKALALAPAAGQVRLLLANVYLKRHDYDNVRVQLDAYLAENPTGDLRAAAQKMRDEIMRARANE
jgi:tetratricopeptide (TPR) repeat protein